MEEILFEIFFDRGVVRYELISKWRYYFTNFEENLLLFSIIRQFSFFIVSIFKLRIIQFIVYSSGDDALYKNIVSFITPLSTSYFAHLALRAIYLIFHMFHLSCFIFCISNFILSVSRFLFVFSVNCNLFNKKR